MTKENSFGTFLQEMEKADRGAAKNTGFPVQARLEKDLAKRTSCHHRTVPNLHFNYWKICCSIPGERDRRVSSESEPQAKSIGHGIELQN